MNQYCIYLRKSRADLEAEAMGEGETLARHKARLMDYARRTHLPVTEIYQEIVSGDTIAARPQMQRLLSDVQAGRWAGVLVTEVQRLARGDTIDQGIVAQTFRYAHTKIITPEKTYDPENEFDEEYFEFGLFMSRREYAAIKRRLWAGRVASVTEGKYMGTRPVYGYRRKKLEGQKGWTMEIDPDSAAVVKMIFDWYLNGMNGNPVGGQSIANRLNDMGLRTYLGNPFEASHIRNILQNPAYIGKVRWNQRTTVKTIVDGQRSAYRPKSDAPIITDGLHPAIIDEATFARVQKMFSEHAKRPKNTDSPIANPLSGLIKCAICGRTLQRKNSYNSRPDLLQCPTAKCPTTGIYLPVAEEAVLDALREWVRTYSMPESAPAKSPEQDVAAQLRNQLESIDRQMDRLYELLEQEVYDTQTFIARRAALTQRREQIEKSLESTTAAPSREAQIIAILPNVSSVLDAYHATDDPGDRNTLLRSVIDHIDYHKTHKCFRNENPCDFLTMDIYPVLLNSNSDSIE